MNRCVDCPGEGARSTRPAALVLGVVALGGAAGSLLRWSLEHLEPASAGAFPWVTFGTNVLGCALIGVLMVVVELRRPGPLVRPGIGAGLLGGFTTFSTYAVQARELAAGGQPLLALAYVTATMLAALFAVSGAVVLTRHALSAGGAAGPRR